jgi:hypothetical protein
LTTPDWLNQVWNVVRIVAPWLTGGLAGAFLAFALNRWQVRKSQPRLSVVVTQINYSLAAHDAQFKPLRVHYDDGVYEELIYYELVVRNTSQKDVAESPFALAIPAATSVVDYRISTQPISRKIELLNDTEDSKIRLCDFGPLKPGDAAGIRLLLSGSSVHDWYFRGSDNVDVVSSDKPGLVAPEGDVRDAILRVAAFVVCGAIPLIGEVFQGLIIVASIPLILRILSHWSHVTTRKAPGTVVTPVVVSQADIVRIDTDPVTGTTSIRTVTTNQPLRRG